MNCKKYIVEICGGVCPLLAFRDYTSHCGHDDAMDLINFKDDCKGDLDNRPSWCPLVDVPLGVPTLYIKDSLPHGRHE
jgi:hypothetical protein